MIKRLKRVNNRLKSDNSINNENKQEYISKSLDTNIKYIKKITNNMPDLVYRQITTLPAQCTLLFFQSICDHDQIAKYIINALNNINDLGSKSLDKIIEATVSTTKYNTTNNMDELFGSLMSGETILLMDGYDFAYYFQTRKVSSRSIEEPSTESVIRGPKNGFTENLQINMSILRGACKDPNLKFEHLKVGRRTKTDILVAYIADVAKMDLVEEVKNRVKRIDVDKVLDTGDVEEYLTDNYNSPFPQLNTTERPDRTLAALFEGKIVVLIGNTPFSIIAPTSIHNLLSSPEDYYEKWLVATVIRISRYLAISISMFLPALYIALTSFNVGLIPRDLVIALASARHGIPFPAFIEAFIMEIGLEFIHEASVRLPKSVGQTVGVVGGLILGEAAVNAGIVSSAMIIIISLTAISSFIIPSYSLMLATRIVRVPLMIVSSIFGLFGLVMGYLFIFIHICSLTSLNEDYIAPWGQYGFSALKDTLFRVPLKSMQKRPEYLGVKDTIKQRTEKNKDWW